MYIVVQSAHHLQYKKKIVFCAKKARKWIIKSEKDWKKKKKKTFKPV